MSDWLRTVERFPLPCWIERGAAREVLAVNDAALALFDCPREEFSASTLRPANGSAGVFVRRSAHGRDVYAAVDRREIDLDGKRVLLAVAIDVTESQREISAIVAREEQFRHLIQNSVEIIYEADVRGIFTFVNDAVTDILGYDPSELVGRHFSELIREDRRAATVDYYRSARDASQAGYLEFPCVAKDGRTVWVGQSVQNVIVDGQIAGFHAITTDVTERRIAEERFLTFMNNSPMVAFMKNADGTYVYSNELMNRVFAKQGATLVGSNDADFLPPDVAATMRENDRQVLQTGTSIQFIESVPDESGVRHWLTYKFPVAGDEGETYVGGMGVDLTDRITLENALAAARDAALVSARQKSQFLANMSHELRTPMNGVIGLIGVLLDTQLDSDQRDLAETARASADSLLNIINDILDFSKIEAGKLTFEAVDFDVRNVCESTVDLLAEAARRKSLEIGYVIDPEIPSPIRGDAGRLRQVLLNLIGNAVKFTEQGGVLLQVERENGGDDSVLLRFRVTDTGIGMDHETRDRLFRPFIQGDASTTRRFGGTGLGLAISKQLVQLMEGDIGLESEPGCGATFWFTARFACRDLRSVTAVAPEVKPKVLVVDESATTRQMIALQLAAWKVPNDISDDSFTALSMLRDQAAAGRPYQVVIANMQMPSIDGVAIARLVKREGFGSPRFILTTGESTRMDASMLNELGISATLRKPIKPQHLFNSLFGDRARPTAPPPTTVREPAAPGRRLLVVEDNRVNQKVILRQLEKLGYVADAVANGVEALEALGRIPYDLVLMDCQMPEMDGYDATREVRRREKPSNAHTPIIALTASASEQDRDLCLASGMDDFVPKPVREVDLSDALQRWLIRSR